MDMTMKRIRGYLRVIDSDNQSLKNLAELSEHNPRVQRLLDFLTAHTSTLHHLTGAVKGIAGMLSGLPRPPLKIMW